MLSKIRKAIRNPKLAIRWGIGQVTIFYYKTRAKISILLEGTTVEIGKNVRFMQRVVFDRTGKVIIGDNTSIGFKYGGSWYGSVCELQPRYPNSIIKLGNNVATNNNLQIIAAKSVQIGDFCLIGNSVQIIDSDGHGIKPNQRHSSIGKVAPVTIGKNVWIGNHVIILKGVTIGDNSIVAAGAVVTAGEYPSNSIIGGNPAKVLRTIRNQ